MIKFKLNKQRLSTCNLFIKSLNLRKHNYKFFNTDIIYNYKVGKFLNFYLYIYMMPQ